jgi:hypothetical protein
MATQSTVGAKMGNTQMVIRLVVAAAALLAASQARAEQVKIC